MAVVIKHKKSVNKPDGTDESIVRPSDWNEEHAVQMTGPALVGKSGLGNGDAEEIEIGDGLKLEGDVLEVDPAKGYVTKTQADQDYAAADDFESLQAAHTTLAQQTSDALAERITELNADQRYATTEQGSKADTAVQYDAGKLKAPTGEEIPIGASSNTVISNETTVSAVTIATANDSGFTAFSDQACTELEIDNSNGMDIDYRRNGAGEYITIRAGQIRRIVGIDNANKISVRRSDYSRNVSQAITVIAKAYTSTEVFTGASISKVTIINAGGNTVLPAVDCTSLELVNTTGKIITWRVGAAAPYRRLMDSDTVVVHGIANSNQIQVKAFDSVIGFKQDLQFEAFTSGLREPLNLSKVARILSAEATIPLDDNYQAQAWPTPSFVEIGETNSQRRTLRAKDVVPLAIFNTVASLTTNRAADFTDAANGEILFGTSAPEYTQSVAYQSLNIAPVAILTTGVDVSSRDIHLSYSLPDNAGINFTVANAMQTFSIQLFSAGTPAVPGANYHEIVISPSAQGFLRPNSALLDSKTGGQINRFGVPIEKAVAVGAGADLSSIKWARIVMGGGSAALANSAKFRAHRIDAVKKARTKAAIVFLFDDMHIGQYLNALPILAKYNYKACIGMDTTVKLGSNGFMTAEQVRNLHQNHGWQVIGQVQGGSQFGGSDASISPEHALRQMSRWKLAMKALGIGETEDFSAGSTSFTSGVAGVSYFENLKVLKRLFRTTTMFLNGNNGQLAPLSLPELCPFPNPHYIKRLNMNLAPAPYTLEQVWVGHLEQAESCKGAAFYGAHSEFDVAGSAFNISFANFVEIVRAKELAGTAEVLTMDELIKSVY